MSISSSHLYSEKESLHAIQRLQAILNTVVDGILTINHKGIIQAFNPAAEHIFGYSVEEVLGKNVKMLMPMPYHKEHDGYLHNYLRTGHAKIIGIGREVTAKRKDGTIFPMELGVSEAGVGDERMFVGIIRDISQRKQAEEKLQQANEKLKNSNKELETFTYIASHDLRTPLVNLKGFTSELQRALDETIALVKEVFPQLAEEPKEKITDLTDNQIPKALRFINNSVEKIDTLTNAILELSRIGHRQLIFRSIKTSELVQKCVDTLKFQIEERNIKVTIGKLPYVVADYISLQQIFGNILDNAIKYLDPQRPGEISIQGERKGRDILFSIKDNGRGIADYNLSKVFEIFRRLDNSMEIEGEGMGMAYVKSLVTRHEGKVWCESKLGEGSTFFFTISIDLKPGEVHNAR